MLEVLTGLFDTAGFLPRGQGGTSWTPTLIWLHVTSDLFIWLAYLSIPLVLLYFTRRRDLPFPRLFLLFALFILACGTTHLLDAIMFEYPVYRVAGVMKMVTAIVSWATVIALIPVVPRVMRAVSDAAQPGTDTRFHRPLPIGRPGRVRWREFIIAILAGVLAVLVRAAIDPMLKDDQIFVVALLAVVYVSWQYGFGPGMVCLVVGLGGYVYFFVPPRYSFVVEGFGSQLAVALFFFCGVACAALGESQRTAQRRARRALTTSVNRQEELESEVARRRVVEAALRQREADLVAAQRETAEALARLNAFLDNAPLGIAFFDPELRYERINPFLAKANNKPVSEHIGRTLSEILPDFPSEILEAYRRVASPNGTSFTGQVQRTGAYAPGETQVWHVTAFPVRQVDGHNLGAGVVAQDVTDRLRAEEDLRRSERNLSDFFENANVGLHWVGPDGIILRANKAELDMLGYTRDEYVGRLIADFHEDQETICDILARLGRGDRLNNYPARLRCKDGTIRDVLISSSVLFEDGRFVHSRCFTRDVTEVKRAADELAEQARASSLRADVAAALASGEETRVSLQECAATLVRRVGAAFARIWTTDLSGQWLELQASAGMYTHIDGSHARIALGQYKIGRIAESRTPHLTNDVQHDPNVSDTEWAAREGMVAFAGYPLVVEGRVLGVLALFSRHKLSDSLVADLGPVVASIAQYLDRRRAEDAVRASEHRFRTLTEAVPQMVWTADPKGTVRFVNRRWEEFTGKPLDDVSTSGWGPELICPEDADRVRARWQIAVMSPSDEFSEEFRLRRAADSAYRWMLSVAVPRRDNAGTVVEWVGTLTDIDDQKQHAQTLERLVRERTVELEQTNTTLTSEIEERKAIEEQLRAVGAELERSNGELEKFAYIASHDLQEPLRKIQAFGDRLRDKCREQLPELGREYIDRMLSAASRMRRLIDDLLSFSRVTTQKRPFHSIDLGKLVREVVSDLDVRIAQSGGKVCIKSLPRIDADPTQMRQLFQNLIANAVKFQRPGVPPVVEVESELANRLPAGHDADEPVAMCRVTVRDNGIGFNEKYRDRIFEMFQRLHRRDEYEGTGVGLAICRKIVERHGGTITAHSREGDGATFVVTLPVQHPNAQARTEFDVHSEQTDHDPDSG
jgi:PAS domain S-box-containing protein